MNKKLLSLTGILALLFALVPASIAEAAPPSEPEAAPLYGDPNGTWDCVWVADGTCPEDPMTVFDYYYINPSDTPTVNRLSFEPVHLKYICSGSGCPQNVTYIKIVFYLKWDTVFNPGNRTVKVYFRSSIGDQHITEFPCGGSTGGSCGGTVYGKIYGGEFSANPDATDHLKVGLSIPGGSGDHHVWSYRVTVSTSPLAGIAAGQTCSEEFLIVENPNWVEIDPTLEYPVGDPTDEQMVSVISGQWYAISTQGGPWEENSYTTNGTTHRYDTAISFDGTKWRFIGDQDIIQIGDDEETEVKMNSEGWTVGCIQPSDSNPEVGTWFVQAESNTLYIHANDAYISGALVPGSFADNTVISALYWDNALAFYFPPPPGCEDQFSYDPEDDLVASVTVEADEPNTLATEEIEVGEWYVIEIVDGSWLDDGTGDPRTDLDFAITSDNPVGAFTYWDELAEGSRGFWCATEEGDKFLVQAVYEPNLFFRVNDEAHTWETNTGSMDLNIYHATFDRALEECEIGYELGDVLYSKHVSAKSEFGEIFAQAASLGEGQPLLSYGLLPGAWYVMDTTGGPWGYPGATHSEIPQYDMAVNSVGSWVELSEWEGANCTVPLDGLGHMRTYFQIPDPGGALYRIRVNDTESWANNYGAMGFNLYRGISLGDTPGECDYSHGEEAIFDNAFIPPTAEDGVWMGTLDTNTIYYLVVKTSTGAWQEYSEGPDLDDVQISSNGGGSWADLPASFYGTLCYETTPGGDLGIYFRTGSSGIGYKMRVDSTSFADNTGYMYYALYGATAGPSIDPWDTCLDGWGLTVLDEFEWIPVRDEEGTYIIPTGTTTQVNDFWTMIGTLIGTVQIPTVSLPPNVHYVVEVKEGPWTDGENPTSHYDAALSSDNGTTWYPIDWDSENLICGELDQLNKYWKAFFYVETGELWKIRVNDADTDTFLDNGGNLAYKLYGASQTGVITEDQIGEPIILGPDSWGDVCLEVCYRPDSILEVTEWIEYARCSFQQFIAWCPRHTDMILGLVNSFQNKEPFATLSEINTLVTDARAEVETYNWDEGPDSVITDDPATFNQELDDMLFPDYSGGPWDGGELVEFGTAQPLSYYTNCTLSLASQLPEKLALGVCFTSSWFIETGANLWIQLGLDLMAAFAILKMMTGDIKGMVNLITGGTTFPK